jgi:hypothetical protein
MYKKKGNYSMNAPGKGILKAASILFIIFGVISIIASIILLAGAGIATAVLGEFGAGALGGLLMAVVVLALIVSVLMLVIGIIGVGKRSGDPSKAGFYIVTGVILCILSLISLVIGIVNNSFQWTSLVSFVLPILYIIGGAMNKKAAVAQ